MDHPGRDRFYVCFQLWCTSSSGVVKIGKDLDTTIEGKNVLVVEDIIDSEEH